MFILLCFHAVVQERRTYIPQGWSRFYEFTGADLRGATDIIEATVKSGKTDWKTIHGLFINVIYGGRLDNIYDSAVLKSHLNIFFSDKAIQGKREFYSGIKVMNATNLGMIKKLVEGKLSNVDNPTMFGLPLNANRSLETRLGDEIVRKLLRLTLQSSLSGSGSGDDEQQKKDNIQLSGMITFWQKLVSKNVNILFTKRKKGEREKDPVVSFFVTEFFSAVDLVKYLNNTFKTMEEIISGKRLMTPKVKVIKDAILRGDIPMPWDDIWEEGPPNIKLWLDQAFQKACALEKLYKIKRIPSDGIALKDFFNPNIFLSGFKQKVARETKQPLDDLVHLQAIWDTRSSTGIIIKDLYMQGATMKNKRLIDLKDDDPPIAGVPKFRINWESKSSKSGNSYLSIPVYYTPQKKRILTGFKLDVGKEDVEKWVMNGLSMFVNP